MDATTKKAVPQRKGRAGSRVKAAIVTLAVWGLITPKATTAILRALGVTHA